MEQKPILIAGATQEHFIHYSMIREEINALKNVCSLTFRLFTEKEDVCNHCNVGNVELTFNAFRNWIEKIKKGVIEFSCYIIGII